MADSSMFSHCDLKKLIPAAHTRNDVLEKGQLKTWFKHVRQIENPVISAYLQTLLLTGARRNELAGLKWADVNLRWNKIQLHDKIEEDGRTIPLTPFCKCLISALPRRNEFVFSSLTSESGHLEEPRIAHKRSLAEAGLPLDLSIHGLRRSFASLSEWVEMPVGIVAQIMGHKPSATAEKHYKRRPIDLLALWHGKLETWILEQAGITFDPSKMKKGLHAV
jgi:integrase